VTVVAWVALGLVVLVIIFLSTWTRFIRQYQREVVGFFDDIDERMAGISAQPESEDYAPLDEEQQRELRVVWGAVACPHCGFLHPGLCPRVREMRYLPNGNPERIIFWPDGEWAVPKGAHSYREVFGTPVPQQPEETKT